MPAALQPRSAADALLERFAALVESRYAMHLGGGRLDELGRKVRARAQQAGHASLADYLAVLEAAPADAPAWAALIEELTIHETFLDRVPAHFSTLRGEILPPLLKSSGRIRLASVGCSYGAEAYSLAMAAAELAGPASPVRIEVSGLDVSEAALAKAREGVFSAFQMREVDPARVTRWFTRLPSGDFRVKPELASRVTFRRANLAAPLPLVGLDVIFCRNVLIYFRAETVDRALGRLHDALAPGGVLFLGPGETASRRTDLFRPVFGGEALYYRRLPARAPGA